MDDSNTRKVLKILSRLSILECVGLTFGLLLARWITRGIYRVYFHPLRRFPGPKISAFTRLPYFFATVTGNEVRYISRLHDEYGDIIRTMPDVSYAPTLGEKAVEKGKGSAKVDMVPQYNFATFDIMADLAFGESLHMLDNVEYDPWVSNLFKGIRAGSIAQTIKVYYPLAWKILGLLFSKTLQKKRYQHFRHSTTRVTKRLDKGRDTQGTDIWDLVLSRQGKGKQGLTRQQMDSNASLFMIAGTETMATQLSGLTCLLLQHPEVKKKLVDELRGAFATDADISMEDTAKLPYLNGCLKEGLRLYPPVAVGLPNVNPPEGSTMCGEFVPPNTIVGSHHHIMYRSPRYFKNPNAFIPERWTGDLEYDGDERSCVQPFSVGPRDCLGRNLALHEVRLILAKVFYNFDLEPTPENKGWFDQKTYFIWVKKPLLVNVRAARLQRI